MAMDGLNLHASVLEMQRAIVGGKIDKVQQPERDELLLGVHAGGGNFKLLLSASAANTRAHLTQIKRNNPVDAPMFCMLLRKYLVGGRVESLTQPGMERSAELTLRVTDEFGRESRRTLVLEAIGRRSNLILLDEERRIIDCLRRVDSEMSLERQVLPGLFYELPPTHEKRPFTEGDEADFRAALAAANPERPADAFLLDTYFGLSPLVARELVFQAAGDSGKRVYELTEAQETALWQAVLSLRQRVEDGDFQPICLYRDGKPAEFSYLPIRQYGDLMENREMESFSALMDVFYESREREERTRQRGQDLIRSVTSARDRCRRKLAQQRQEFAKCQDRDQLRISGELITANLYRMERGQTKLTAENYYDPDCREITIPLDPLLTPQQNAAKYYKDYARMKNAEKELTKQLELGRLELDYLKSVLEELNRAGTEGELEEIRRELQEGGYLRPDTDRKRMKQAKLPPMRFESTDGYPIYVGRNNRQNDELTFRLARKDDIWCHASKVHGSHVIISCGGTTPPDDTVTQAAQLAAYYAETGGGQNIPVDVTAVKQVKKIPNGKPGMVIYHTYRTVIANPYPDIVVDALNAETKE